MTGAPEDGTETQRREKADAYFAAIGRVVVLWSEVELELFSLLRVITGLDRRTAAVIYDRASSIRPRIELIKELLSAVSAGPVDEVIDVLSRLAAGTEVRNMLVHHPASWQGARVTLALPEDGDGSVVVVSHDVGEIGTDRNLMSVLRGKKGPAARIATPAIVEHHDKVCELRAELIRAAHELRQALGPASAV